MILLRLPPRVRTSVGALPQPTSAGVPTRRILPMLSSLLLWN